METNRFFKKCPSCLTEWRTRDDFLCDPGVTLNGYRVDFKELEFGLFFFIHKKENCLSTMTMLAREFIDLYDGPRLSESKEMTSECPRYCMDENNLDRCNVLCECAFVREIVHMIREKQKAERA
jgi:hypothetical protein